MTIGSDEAAATLADIDSVVAKVKQSRVYRASALAFVLWGCVALARQGLILLAPSMFGPRWFLIDLVGVAGTLILLRRAGGSLSRFPFRILAAYAIFYGFGWVWAHAIGGFGPRQEMAFWPTLFLFGYALAGLWFGVAFAVIGIGLSALLVAAYLWAGEAFPLVQPGVTGLGFILCGLWMRRA